MNAASGTFASTAMHLPSGRRTTRSGRRVPSTVVVLTCRSKSTRFVSPALSTRRRSCVSPHAPRIELCRSAAASDSAVFRTWSEEARVAEQLLLERAVLRGALLLELVDLALHGPQGLLHRRERGEHAALLLLAAAALLRLGGAGQPLLLRAALGGTELALQAVDGRLVRGQLGAEVAGDPLALRPGAEQVGLVAPGDRRVLHGPSPAGEHGAEQHPDEDADEQSGEREQSFHARMVAAGSDSARGRGA